MKRNPQWARHDRYVVGAAKLLYAINYLGRYCKKCNFDGFEEPWFMDFHHRDGDQKEYCVKNRIMQGNFERFRTELDKCDLLCGRCHRMFHAKSDRYRELHAEIMAKLEILIDNEGKFNAIRPFSDEEIQTLKEKAAEGWTRKRIASFMNREYGSVKSKLSHLGIKCSRSLPSNIDLDRAIKLFRQKVSLRKIGAELGVSYMTVAHHLRCVGEIEDGVDLRRESVVRENQSRSKKAQGLTDAK